jgi:hypothetical protein
MNTLNMTSLMIHLTKLISSIPSHSKMFSSLCHFIQIIKGKTPSINITMQTW